MQPILNKGEDPLNEYKTVIKETFIPATEVASLSKSRSLLPAKKQIPDFLFKFQSVKNR